MRRPAAIALGLGCLLGLVVACYGPALFGGQQFGYRDAAHFYYPLYQRVQQEWAAGRVPLWDPGENAGMPLLGNPTAAVLYPGKLVYSALPYPDAARWYIVLHSLLAAAGMYALGRSWGVSRSGSGVAALSYAFGAPVLFQYCNVIFLVGAAWLPWALLGADRWLRGRRIDGLILLAVALAMQVLGGDPQSAYLSGLAAAGLALMVKDGSSPTRPRRSGKRRLLLVLVGLIGWTAATLVLAAWLPGYRAKRMPVPVVPWTPYVKPIVLGIWSVVALVFLIRARKSAEGRGQLGGLAGLIVAAVVAGALTGAQLLPVMEFSRRTTRAAGEGPHDVYPFSVEPHRLVELAWPNAYGTGFGGNRDWPEAIPPAHEFTEWTPSLYLGGATVVLALAAILGPAGPPWKRWLKVVALLAILGALGQFGGPLFWARRIPAIAEVAGQPDPPDVSAVRLDGQFRDGDGSIYWMMTILLPGFDSFRYPAKLFTFAALALAGLAGAGWDEVRAGRGKTARWLAVAGLAISVVGLVAAVVGRSAFIDWLKSTAANAPGTFGMFDPVGAWRDLLECLGHAAIVAAILLGLLALGRRRPVTAGALLLIGTAADLAVANARMVLTVDQSEFEVMPRALAAIEAAEREKPASGPFRVHRMPAWQPAGWLQRDTESRGVTDLVRWERATLQPKYGLPLGVSYTRTEGTAELYDFEFFFAPFRRRLAPELGRSLGLKPDEPLVYYPRRGFDLWATRYFILPSVPDNVEQRGIASFLPATTPIFPGPESFAGPGGPDARYRWSLAEDWQLVRNEAALPRSWIVHEATTLPPIRGMRRVDREGTMIAMLYPGDPFWTDPSLTVPNLRRTAWIETDDRAALAPFLTGGPSVEAERVAFVVDEPQRVVLDATLERPGLVVLADVNYPGWRLTIDGKEAPILLANRAMRGAAVSAGRHRLEYRYEPMSFRVGLAVSAAGAIGLAGLVVAAARRRGNDRRTE